MEQVRRAVLQGLLVPGDRLPPAREVVAELAINPNTVLKAYSKLEYEGILLSRPGSGTFVSETAPAAVPESVRSRLLPSLEGWMMEARRAGLRDDAIYALFTAVLQAESGRDVA